MTANSSNRHLAQQQASQGEPTQPLTHQHQAVYKPLSGTSTRFLKIKAAGETDERIFCEILEIPFIEKPNFEALSYRWGNDMARKCILLNGIERRVKQNLFDALQYLRCHRTSDALFWIDALCINQDDKEECSMQVRMMRTIYFRAYAVVVWLGKKYEKYETFLPQLEALIDARSRQAARATAVKPDTEARDLASVAATGDESTGLALAKEFYHDEYWNRVWIVQEIGLAQRLAVCFGNYSMTWVNVVHFITMYNIGTGGPVKLQDQRSRKYDGGCRLLRLLHDYKDAQCQDPKDKVYGLIGLATDARHFPIDYKKSLFEIWKDVMEFANMHGLFQPEQIVPTGSLVKYLLMGDSCDPLDQALRPYIPVVSGDQVTVMVDKPYGGRTFSVPVKALGCVRYVGSRPDEIIENPNMQEDWEGTVQSSFREMPGPAHAESDMLLRSILDPSGPDLSMSCFTYSSTVSWTTPGDYYESLTRFQFDMIRDQQRRPHNPQQHISAPTSASKPQASMRLYQLDCFGKPSKWRMGLATDQARPGDVICWVASSHRALILRPQQNERSWKLQAIGTAVVAQDLRGVTIQTHQRRFADFHNDTMKVYIDAAFIFILLETKGLV